MPIFDSSQGSKAPKHSSHESAAGVRMSPGPFIGVVKNNIDPMRTGRLQVFIPELGGNPDDQSSWRTVAYASPYMGTTPPNPDASGMPSSKRTGQTFAGNPHSYGFFMVPPDINNSVICIFINGDPFKGYWFACIPDWPNSHMVPAIGYSDALPKPAVEYNSDDSTSSNIQDFWARQKTQHDVVVQQMEEQGVINDPMRGPISSTPYRESPSYVYGFSSPGRKLSEQWIKCEGAQEPWDESSNGRMGGHSLVMDDGDTDGNNQLMRLRTAQGHQFTMHDSGGFIHLMTQNGNAWFEMDYYGNINIYAGGDFNVKAKGRVQFDADNGIYITSKQTINISGQQTVSISSIGALNLSAIGFIKMSSMSGTHISGTNLYLTGRSCTQLIGQTHMDICGKCITLNSAKCTPAQSAGSATSASGMPGPEPWGGHRRCSSGNAAASQAQLQIATTAASGVFSNLSGGYTGGGGLFNGSNPTTPGSIGGQYGTTPITAGSYSLGLNVPTSSPPGSGSYIPITEDAIARLPANLQTDTAFLNATNTLAASKGIAANDLLNVWSYESLFKSTEINRIGAAGLMQVIPSNLARTGLTSEQFAALSPAEQVQWASENLYKNMPSGLSREDLYLYNFMPAVVNKTGAAGDVPLGVPEKNISPETVAAQNPSLRDPVTGYVTANSVRAAIANKGNIPRATADSTPAAIGSNTTNVNPESGYIPPQQQQMLNDPVKNLDGQITDTNDKISNLERTWADRMTYDEYLAQKSVLTDKLASLEGQRADQQNFFPGGDVIKEPNFPPDYMGNTPTETSYTPTETPQPQVFPGTGYDFSPGINYDTVTGYTGFNRDLNTRTGTPLDINQNGNVTPNVDNLPNTYTEVLPPDQTGIPLTDQQIRDSINASFPVDSGTDPFSLANAKTVQDAAAASDQGGGSILPVGSGTATPGSIGGPGAPAGQSAQSMSGPNC